MKRSLLFFRNVIIIYIGKLIYFVARIFSFGSGSTWPGHIALYLNNNFIKDFFSLYPTKIILVIGTNGKTTTASLISHLCKKNSILCFQNKEGANLLNGIASSIISNISFNFRFTYQCAVFEIDENNLSSILSYIEPYAILILSLFRDQLDRYGEVNAIADKWYQSLNKLRKRIPIIINGDDPQLYFLGTKLVHQKVLFFGIKKEDMKKRNLSHDIDFIYCPKCRSKLTYEAISFSHLGMFVCASCGFSNRNVFSFENIEIKYPIKGIYNKYNIHGALFLCNFIFHISFSTLISQLSTFVPVFGRQEIILYKNKNYFLILSKNPAGFNQSIQVMNENANKKSTILIALNNRIPDGRDISWIWDVNFEEIYTTERNILLAGDRVYDLAIRFRYSLETPQLPENINIYKNLEEALRFSHSSSKGHENIYILSTYSAMLEIRKLLVGRSLL